MSGLKEVDPSRLMSLEAVQLLREVGEDTEEGTEQRVKIEIVWVLVDCLDGWQSSRTLWAKWQI